jgi:glycosyltransferase involved in cell wall biosynthesis
MKTLIISPFSPYPLVFGGAIRVYHLVKMFAQFSDVTLVSYMSWGAGTQAEQHLETICERVILVDSKPKATPSLRARSLVHSRSYQYASHFSDHFQGILQNVLAETQFDYIVTEMTQMGYFACNQPGAFRILDMQNIEHELLLRRADVETNLVKRAALRLEARKFLNEELAICRTYDLIFTPSERERDTMQAFSDMPPVECLPNSIDPEFFALRSSTPQANEIAFIGTTHVDANRDGLIYFMEEIFPLIERDLPDVTLKIVGGSPPPEITVYGQRSNVEVTGFVEDVRTYMQRAKALIVPLRSGGGTRLKILEGLSYGVPTVSTSIGAEGLELIDDEHILLADTPEQFAAQVVRLANDPDLQERLRLSGRQFVEHHYSWQAVGRQLQHYLEQHARSVHTGMPTSRP